MPQQRGYDLVSREAIDRLLADARPDIAQHLASAVGGIGAGLANPGRFFYENATMGIQLVKQSRPAGVGKSVALGTVRAYPKLGPLPHCENDLERLEANWHRISEAGCDSSARAAASEGQEGS